MCSWAAVPLFPVPLLLCPLFGLSHVYQTIHNLLVCLRHGFVAMLVLGYEWKQRFSPLSHIGPMPSLNIYILQYWVRLSLSTTTFTYSITSTFTWSSTINTSLNCLSPVNHIHYHHQYIKIILPHDWHRKSFLHLIWTGVKISERYHPISAFSNCL